MKLQFARLSYGSSIYPVHPNDLLPIPEEFDFANAVECAQRIFAIMSNASGGHVLHDCTLRIYPTRKSANLTANGCHVYFTDPGKPKLLPHEVLALAHSVQVYHLGSVRTDQYGQGWARPVWRHVGPSREFARALEVA